MRVWTACLAYADGPSLLAIVPRQVQSQPLTGGDEIQVVAGTDVIHGVTAALAAPAPPLAAAIGMLRPDPEAVFAAAEGTRPGILAAVGARHALQAGIALDQAQQIDA